MFVCENRPAGCQKLEVLMSCGPNNNAPEPTFKRGKQLFTFIPFILFPPVTQTLLYLYQSVSELRLKIKLISLNLDKFKN